MSLSRPTSRVFGYLPALLLALFLGAQLELAAHLHADGNPVGDCVQCQFDSGHAAVPTAVRAAPAPPLSALPGRVAVRPRVNSRYRPNPRGPPTRSW